MPMTHQFSLGDRCRRALRSKQCAEQFEPAVLCSSRGQALFGYKPSNTVVVKISSNLFFDEPFVMELAGVFLSAGAEIFY